MINLAVLLDQSGATYPESVAIVFGDTRLTDAQVNGRVNQLANLLVSRDGEPGDKVALSCTNLPYSSIIYFGFLKSGETIGPLNVLPKAREVGVDFDDSDAKAVSAYEGTAELLIGGAVWEGFNAIEGTKDSFVITADPSGDSPVERTETFGAAAATLPPTFDTVRVHDDDTAVTLYTFATTGQPRAPGSGTAACAATQSAARTSTTRTRRTPALSEEAGTSHDRS